MLALLGCTFQDVSRGMSAYRTTGSSGASRELQRDPKCNRTASGRGALGALGEEAPGSKTVPFR